jgi:hypothetical protein
MLGRLTARVLDEGGCAQFDGGSRFLTVGNPPA